MVLSTFLNTPPSPPPPNVPTLEESNKEAGTAAPKTVREQLELHRKNPGCASCHKIIDPPGFALENFNSVGQWRDTDADGKPIDAAGVLADGTKVDGPVALREAILGRPEAFVTTLAERMLTYALGRGIEPPDMPVVRRIVRKAAPERLSFPVDHHRHRRERTVPDADQVGAGRTRQQRRPNEGGLATQLDAQTVHHEEAPVPSHVPARYFRRYDRAALPGRDGACVYGNGARGRDHSPFRFGAIYMPNGVSPDTWHPEKEGLNFDFKPVMQPLEPLRDQLVTVSKMKAPWGASVHLGASSAFLNGSRSGRDQRRERATPSGRSSRRRRSISISPIRWPQDTPLRSIEVGTEDMGTAVGACDGFACTFFNALSWRDDTSPLPVGINPRVTFERMFGETGSAEQRAARLKEKQSLLDSVTQETARLRGSLGAPDRAILDEYLGNIREVEQQLDRMESRMGTLTDNPEAPVGLPEAFDDHMTVTYNLMHLAFQGDISRVFTFMVGHEASDRGYAHIGIPETHHSISHHGNDAEKLAKCAKIGTYQIVKLAEFLEKLKATKDGDGTLLDHSLLYWGSGMSNGNAHDRNNPPAVLVGGACGGLKGNRHVVAKKDEPTANLLLAMAHLAGAQIESLGPSTGRLDL